MYKDRQTDRWMDRWMDGWVYLNPAYVRRTSGTAAGVRAREIGDRYI